MLGYHLWVLTHKFLVFHNFRYTDNFHVKFGRISNLSTRKGKAVFLEDILNEAKERMIKTIQSKQSKYLY